MFYGAVEWDPWLIVGQIVCLQCLYYLTHGVFLSFLVGTRVSRMSLVYSLTLPPLLPLPLPAGALLFLSAQLYCRVRI
ncbi:putative sulfate transporter 3.4-like isoform 2 [Hibiscus syriacus]|uniref:Sulfate transporter 3.4-like isoform 2 n=1 Tax=Hibiscus syriacus TaxID=106335 RepID=A0A6A2YN52_HIBSY|nr:putative sulfate transporter 3.4-like isoform 2 [Hibiscus syriacus]